MKILIAEDDLVSRTVLTRRLEKWGHEVIATLDGRAAWEILQRDDAPKLAILDWMMPEMDGLDVCRRVRAVERAEPTYLILLTAKHQVADIIQGLDSGANDYLVKPYDRRELRSRLQVGERTVTLQHGLAERVRELHAAKSTVSVPRASQPVSTATLVVLGLAIVTFLWTLMAWQRS